MRVETITYEDYNGETHTDDFYFNLNKAELMEFSSEFGENGVTGALERLKRSRDPKITLEVLKKFMELAYGEKEGAAFRKYDEKGNRLVYNHFFSTEAYSELFTRMLQGDGSEISDFIADTLPKDMREGAIEEMNKAQKEVEQKKAAFEAVKAEVVAGPGSEQK